MEKLFPLVAGAILAWNMACISFCRASSRPSKRPFSLVGATCEAAGEGASFPPYHRHSRSKGRGLATGGRDASGVFNSTCLQLSPPQKNELVVMATAAFGNGACG